MKPLIQAVFSLFFGYIILFAQTIIPGGDVSGTWTPAESPYQIQDSVKVPAGSTLVIQPGVTVEFVADARFIVYGTLTANGTLTDSIIFTVGGSATQFSGIRFRAGSSGSMSYCRVSHGNKNGGADPYDSYGGAILIYGTDNVTISNCVIRNNHAEIGGGGIALYNSAATVQNCKIYNNSVSPANPVSAYGGGLYVRGNAFIENNQVFNNQCTSVGNASGGGINIVGGAPIIRNNIVYSNSAKRGGGFSAFAGGDGTLVNNVVYGNSATSGDGGGLYMDDATTNILIYNTIFWNNTATGNGSNIYLANGTCTVDYSDLQGGNSSVSEAVAGAITYGANNINQDPLFADVTNNAFYLLPGSPCIDAGTSANAPTADFNGNPTNQDGNNDGSPGYDMGSFEYLQDVAVFGAGQLSQSFTVNTFESSPSTIAGITLNNYSSGSGNFTVACFTKAFPLNAPTGSKAVYRWYRISESGDLIYSDATITLHYSDQELALSNLTEANLTLWHYENGVWINKGGTVDVAQNTVTVSAVNPAGDWAFADLNDHSLPVDLISLEAIPSNNHVEIKWVTENEVDIQGFEIYKREGNQEYKLLSSFKTNPNLRSKGNSNSRNQYSFSDYNVLPDHTYDYLLMELTISNERNEVGRTLVRFKTNQLVKQFDISHNYPNPFNPVTHFAISVTGRALYELRIFNSLGQSVYSEYRNLSTPGTYQFTWNPGNLPAGTYFYSIKLIDPLSHKIVSLKDGKMLFIK